MKHYLLTGDADFGKDIVKITTDRFGEKHYEHSWRSTTASLQKLLDLRHSLKLTKIISTKLGSLNDGQYEIVACESKLGYLKGYKITVETESDKQWVSIVGESDHPIELWYF